MRHVVDIILVDEVESDDPGAGANDLVDPLAVQQDVTPLLLRHHYFALLGYGFVVTGDAHDQVNVREKLLGLFEDARVPNVIHVEDTVGVDAHWVIWVCTVVQGLFWAGFYRSETRRDITTTAATASANVTATSAGVREVGAVLHSSLRRRSSVICESRW